MLSTSLSPITELCLMTRCPCTQCPHTLEPFDFYLFVFQISLLLFAEVFSHQCACSSKLLPSNLLLLKCYEIGHQRIMFARFISKV